MPTKKPSPPSIAAPTRHDAGRVALEIAPDMGWTRTTLRDVAEALGCDLSALRALVRDKDDLLVAFNDMIDQATLKGFEADLSLSVRDTFFDILMTRFDHLKPYRAGIASVLDGIKTMPLDGVCALPHLARSMQWIAEAVGIETSGLKGCLRVTALTGVYLHVLRVWLKDESEEMSATMAALDKSLSRVESLAGRFAL